MVEGQFILRNITQDNLRFYYVLGALPESAYAARATRCEDYRRRTPTSS
jgi:hypothetical protein